MVLLVFAGIATWQALSSNNTMYEMVQQAYSVPLVGAFAPLAVGLAWKGATTRGAILSIFTGILVWQAMDWFVPEFLIPSQLCGLVASLVAIVVGSLVLGGPSNPMMHPAGHPDH